MRSIPCNFKIPNDFNHLYVFEMGAGQIAIEAGDGRLYLDGRGTFENESVGLDWIQETVERIRVECGGKK